MKRPIFVNYATVLPIVIDKVQAHIPLQLINSLRDLKRLLRDEELEQTVRVFKDQDRQGAAYWTALPCDWWAVCRNLKPKAEPPRVPDAEAIHQLLSWALGLSRPAEMPVIPGEAGYPYATCLAFADPRPFSNLIDTEAIACSRELNLVNALFV